MNENLSLQTGSHHDGRVWLAPSQKLIRSFVGSFLLFIHSQSSFTHSLIGSPFHSFLHLFRSTPPTLWVLTGGEGAATRQHRVHTRILSVCYASGMGVGTKFYKAKSPTRGAHTLVRETANQQTVCTHGDAPVRHGREQHRAVSREYKPERPNSHHSLWQRALQFPTLSAHMCSLHTWELPGSMEELLTRMEQRGS